MRNIFTKGITLLEVLVVIVIIIILITVVLPSFAGMRENQALKNGVEDIVSSLHTAKSETLASIDSSEYGVHFEENRLVIFKGKIYTENATTNKVISLVSPAKITNVTLGGVSGVSGDLYFERISGDPSKSGSITVSTSSKTKRIDISLVGSVTLN